MFLSRLWIDVGDNPDRPRPGRLWLRNLYHVHQRLCMAFPSDPRKIDDPNYLNPFNPGDFGDGQIHVERKTDSGFLYRIDPHPGGRVVILVQSAIEPDWDYAFHNAGYLLTAKPEMRKIDPCFSAGQHYRFRLVANPTRRLRRESIGSNGQAVDEKWIGKRVPVTHDRLFEWLACKTEQSGFSVNVSSTVIRPGYSYFRKQEKNELTTHKANLRSVLYEGTLRVTDSGRFRQTLIRGIGPAKAFGFGLLSVAPA